MGTVPGGGEKGTVPAEIGTVPFCSADRPKGDCPLDSAKGDCPLRVLVTGGAGFIGSCLVRQLVAGGETVLNLDKLSYAGNLATLADVADHREYEFRQVDLCDAEATAEAVAEFQPTIVMHLAAETHVDRSIDAPRAFVESNVVGTFHLLQACLMYWQGLDGDAAGRFRFVHCSTDEVYGSLGAEGRFTEETPYDPHSPYAASKAASDHLVRGWRHTYGLPAIVTNSSNNFGPHQFPEKLIPATIRHALAGERIPVYSRGENVRDWIFVDDHCRALWLAGTRGRVGETYNIGAGNERRNIDVVTAICALLDELRPRTASASYAELITFVTDRPGHDFRYALDASKIRRELGWEPTHAWSPALRHTVEWYLDNESAWQPRLDELTRSGRGALA